MSDLPPGVIQGLEEKGFAIVPGALKPPAVAALIDTVERLWAEEGDAAGEENYAEGGVRRLANLGAKGPLFRALAVNPMVLAAARHVCGASVRLSMLNARDVPAGSTARQPWHCDTDDGAVRDEVGALAFTAVWWLDGADAASGATVLLPASHKRGRVPASVLDDLSATLPGEVVVSAAAGDLLLFDGHLWHAGGANRSDGHRRAVLVHYFRAGVPRRDDRRPHIGPDVDLNVVERELLGLDEP